MREDYVITGLRIDIILWEETYCTRNFVNMFSNSWKGKVIHAVSDSSHSRGGGVCVCVI